MKISDLPTPAALVDLDIMARNLHRVVGMCQASGVSYRPHVKTHKVPALAARQMEAGATGITCAKISEAEVMAREGLREIFIAYPVVGCNRLQRLMALSEGAHVSVGVDSAEGGKALSDFFAAQSRKIDVLLEIDTGHHRCGVLPHRAEELAVFLTGLKGIRLCGVFTHEGHVYAPGSVEDRLARAHGAAEQLVRVVRQLGDRGIPLEIVSVGSSPARDAACKVSGVTENRPGTNIFNDATQVHLGACGWEDCALTYSCTIVSRPAPDQAVIDGGSKTFSSDHLSDWCDFGVVRSLPGARFRRASEEHGILALEDEASRRLQVGQRVQVIPSHACGSINLQESLYGVRGETVVEEWRVAARGCVQ